MIAVLNGSTSASTSALRERIERQAEKAEKDHVLDRPEPLVQPPGHVICGMLSRLRRGSSAPAARRTDRASRRTAPAPRTAALPRPRPQDEDERRRQEELPAKPVINALVKVSTLTTESCALAYQPSQTSVKARKPRRRPRSAGGASSGSWKKKIAVSTSKRGYGDGDRAHAFICQMLTQSGWPPRPRRHGAAPARGDLGGARRHQILLWQGVAEVEGQCRLVSPPGASLHQKLHLQGRRDVEGEVGRHDKQRDLAKLGAPSAAMRQARVVAVAKAHALAVLEQLDPVEDAAADIARTLEGIGSIARDEQCA